VFQLLGNKLAQRANCQLPNPNRQLPTPNRQLPTPNRQLPTRNPQLPTTQKANNMKFANGSVKTATA